MIRDHVTLHNNKAIPAVFLTGGIGVILVRSIVLQAIHDQLERELYVFDFNNRPEDAAFLNEHEETGFITKAMLSKYLGDLMLPIFYVVGPQGMVAACVKH